MTKPSRTKPAPVDELDEETYLPPDVEFQQKLAELGADEGGEIKVYREGPGGYRDLTFIRTFALSEFEPSMLQSPPFNGGRFRVHLRSRTGILHNTLLKVEPVMNGAAREGGNGVSLTLPPNDLSAVVAAINSNFEKMAALIAAPKTNPINDALAILGALEKLRPAQTASAPMMGSFSQIAELLDMADKLRGGESSILGSFGRALDKFAEPLGQVLSKVAERKLAENPGAVAALAGPAEAAAPSDFTALLAQYGPVILAQARGNKDPAPYVGIVLDNVDNAAVLEFLNRPDWFELIVAALPNTDVLQHRAWFEEFRTLALDELTAPPESSENATGDAKPDKPAT